MQVAPHVSERDEAARRRRAPRRAAVRRRARATTTSNRPTSAGSSPATYVCAPPVSASVMSSRILGRRTTWRCHLFWRHERGTAAPRCRAAGVLAVVALRLVGDRRRRLRARRVVPGRAARAGRARGLRPSSDAPPAAARRPRWALAALAGFTVWSFCSIAWADARGDAWDGANRTLLYLTVFALFAAVPWTARGGGGRPRARSRWRRPASGLGDRSGARRRRARPCSSTAGSPAPIGYENASAALFLAAFWAALLLAAHRPTPRWARGVLLAAAGLLLQLTILAQSRGSLVAGVVTLAVAVALVRDRVPLLGALLAVAAVAAASLPTLLSVYEAAPRGARPRPGRDRARPVGRAALRGRPRPRAAERWAARARAPRPRGGRPPRCSSGRGGGTRRRGRRAGATRASPPGLGSGRYDFWRVATLEFARHPIGGVGADNFAHDYVRERRRREEPLYPHSLALRAVAQTGAVGGALLALFLGAVVLAVRRLPARRPRPPDRGGRRPRGRRRLGGPRLDRLAVGGPGRRSAGDGLPRPRRGAGPAGGRRSGPGRRPPVGRRRVAPAPRRCPRAAGAVGAGGRRRGARVERRSGRRAAPARARARAEPADGPARSRRRRAGPPRRRPPTSAPRVPGGAGSRRAQLACPRRGRAARPAGRPSRGRARRASGAPAR